MDLNFVAPVGVLGFGVEGQSTFNYLVRAGIKEIVVMDKNPVALPAVPAGVNVKTFSGEGYLDGLKDCVTVVRSAGVYPMSQELFKFQMNGGLMTSQIQLFLEQTKSKKTVGVTGTLGKGSTVSMISHILTKCGIENEIGGNFGVPALDLLERSTANRISILELSSFQLMTLSVSPDVAVVLRVSTEHLDWHKSVEEYRDAKANLVRWQKRDGACVYLKDAAPTAKIASESPARTKYAVALTDGPSAGEGDELLSGMLNNNSSEVRGIYQLEKMAAATLACKALGVPVADAFEALKTYETLPFRMEFKGEKMGIEFFNDSYATRPDATIAATASMDRPFALILGGSEKNADFTELSNILVKERPNLKRIALIGATAERMLESLTQAGLNTAGGNGSGIRAAIFPTLEEAFQDSLSIGKGGIVIMSPACASFGLFKNYKERGKAFDRLVEAL